MSSGHIVAHAWLLLLLLFISVLAQSALAQQEQQQAGGSPSFDEQFNKCLDDVNKIKFLFPYRDEQQLEGLNNRQSCCKLLTQSAEETDWATTEKKVCGALLKATGNKAMFLEDVEDYFKAMSGPCDHNKINVLKPTFSMCAKLQLRNSPEDCVDALFEKRSNIPGYDGKSKVRCCRFVDYQAADQTQLSNKLCDGFLNTKTKSFAVPDANQLFSYVRYACPNAKSIRTDQSKCVPASFDERFKPCIESVSSKQPPIVAPQSGIRNVASAPEKCCYLLENTINEDGTTKTANKFCAALTKSSLKPKFREELESYFNTISAPCEAPLNTMLSTADTQCAKLTNENHVESCVEAFSKRKTIMTLDKSYEDDIKHCCQFAEYQLAGLDPAYRSHKLSDALCETFLNSKSKGIPGIVDSDEMYRYVRSICPASAKSIRAGKSNKCRPAPFDERFRPCIESVNRLAPNNPPRSDEFLADQEKKCCNFLANAISEDGSTRAAKDACYALKYEKRTQMQYREDFENYFKIIRSPCPAPYQYEYMFNNNLARACGSALPLKPSTPNSA